MAKYKDKWKTTFPASIGNQTRPEDGVDNTQEYNTDGLPQYMANDPVRYDLQNAVNSQLVSNDERLNEKIKRTSDDLAAHNKDPKAHATGIAGNAATATKLQTARTLSLTGKAAGSTTFDGSANASINVTSVNADTASKLSTARKINITGNATGSAAFDGSGNIDIKTTVSEAAHAQKATDADTVGGVGIRSENDGYNKTLNKPYIPIVGPDGAIELGNMVDIHSTYGAKEDFNVRLTPDSGYLRAQAYGTEGQANTIHTTGYIGDLKGNAATATKLATPRAISLTGNASGSANFDGSDNVSINTTVSQATAANALNSMGLKTAIKDGTREPLNLSLYQVYNNGYPVSYGNLLSIGGAGGGELLAEWSGSDKGIGHLYYRNRRDAGNLWSDWRTVAFTSDINSFAPTKTGGGASGTWGISISGNAASATNAGKVDCGDPGSFIVNKPGYNDYSPTVGGNYANVTIDSWFGVSFTSQCGGTVPKGKTAVGIDCREGIVRANSFEGTLNGNATNADTVDGYHASDLLGKMQGVLPKTAAEVGQFRELVVNDSHQIKLPDGGTWAYFVYTYTSWSGDNSNNEHRTRTGAGIAAGGTVLHTDGSITSNTINAFELSGTAGAGGTDGNNIIVGGFCWRIA